MAVVLLTGASGLVGSRLLPRLAASGFECRALVRGDLEGYRAGQRGQFRIPEAAIGEWIRPAADTEATRS